MLKILYHLDTPHPGGAANQLRTLVRAIDRTHFSPIVTCGTYPALDEWAATLQTGYESDNDREQKIAPVFRQKLSSPRDLQALGLMEEILTAEKPDLVHLHLSHSGSCRQALFACAKKKIPVVATEHDPFPLSLPKKIVKQQTLSVTDHTIALSRGTRDFLLAEYRLDPSLVSIVHNGIPIAEFQSVAPLERKRFGIPDDHIVITTIAELHQRKGVRFLLEAAAKIVPQFPNVTFIIVGDGEERDFLRQKEVPRVHFFSSAPDVKQILATTNLYVLPSIREAFGLTVLEAFAYQIPVVATETAGPLDIITTNETGILVPPGDAVSLERAIVSLLKDPELRARIGANGYKALQKSFTDERMARETETIYRKVLRVS